MWRHALPNALVPVLTILGMQFSFLLAGGVIIENVFFLPGLGRLVFQAIVQRDLIVVQSVVLILVFAVVMRDFLGGSCLRAGQSALAGGARRMNAHELDSRNTSFIAGAIITGAFHRHGAARAVLDAVRSAGAVDRR